MSTLCFSITTRPLAPIETLPNELLATIFAYGSRPSTHNSFRDSNLPFPLLVSSINKHWRDVALNSPGVWSCVYISGRQPLDVTRTWIRRSKGCMLDVTLNLRFVRQADVDPIIDIIVPHVGRWRRFFLHATNHAGMDKVLSSIRRASAPHLKFFGIRNFGYVGEGSVRSRILLHGTPVLQSVQLEYVPLWCSPPLVGLHTLNLDHVLPTYAEFRDIATSCPSLSELILRNFYPNLQLHEPVTILSLSSLNSLAIKFDQSQSSAPRQSFLSFLSFPNLEYLELSHCHLPELFQHFPRDGRLWFPRLQTLRLSHATISNCVKFLHTLSTISHLQLIHLSDLLKPAKETSAQFAGEDELISPPDRLVWPNLKVVTMETNSLCHLDALDALCFLVQYRIDIGRPLSRVRLSPLLYRCLIGGSRRAISDSALRDMHTYDIDWFRSRVEVDVMTDPDPEFIY